MATAIVRTHRCVLVSNTGNECRGRMVQGVCARECFDEGRLLLETVVIAGGFIGPLRRAPFVFGSHRPPNKGVVLIFELIKVINAFPHRAARPHDVPLHCTTPLS